MRRSGNAWILLIMVICGAVIGGLAAEILSPYPFFKWMSLGGSGGYRELFAFSFNPLIDMHVLKFGFNLAVRINAGSIIGIFLAILLYNTRR
jgi:hypothetical protein